MPTLHIEVNKHGPLFDGNARRIINDYCDDAAEGIGDYAVTELKKRFHETFKHPTGYYESRVSSDRPVDGLVVVDDDRVVYGPWLEGTGSRNYPVTRFKGYANWRHTKSAVEARARSIAERVWDDRAYAERL